MERSYLKSRGKAAFKANYWKTVLVAFLLAIAVGGLGASASSSVDYNGDTQSLPSTTQESSTETYTEEEFEEIDPFNEDGTLVEEVWDAGSQTTWSGSSPISVNIGDAGSIGAIGFILTIFLFGPLEVGCRNFLKKNLKTPAELDELNAGFKPKYWHNLATMLLRNVFISLWSLLLIIPGIVMSYAYAMTPYLLSDYPELQAKEVTDLSRKMMKGHKWDLFVLDLSFIGWMLLSVLTLGILEVFYVGPYMASTRAAFYEELKARSDEVPAA